MPSSLHCRGWRPGTHISQTPLPCRALVYIVPMRGFCTRFGRREFTASIVAGRCLTHRTKAWGVWWRAGVRAVVEEKCNVLLVISYSYSTWYFGQIRSLPGILYRSSASLISAQQQSLPDILMAITDHFLIFQILFLSYIWL